MKRYLSLAIAIMALMVLVTATAQAQVFGSQTLHARIPFAFNVGRTELPAGEYTIKVLNPNSDRKVLQIKSTDGKLSAIINTSGVKANTSDNAKVVFNRYGEKYFFAQAQMVGDQATLTAVKSGVERDTEHSIAKNVNRARVTIIAGN
jgi:hypothetical protein